MIYISTEKNQNSEEKQAITDTGSGVFSATDTDFSPKNGEISAENTVFSGIAPKTNEIEANAAQAEENQDKNSQIQGQAEKIEENHSNLFSQQYVSELKREFPAVDIENLYKSENFQALIGVINKNPTLLQVYSVFNAISKSIEEKAQEKALHSLANSKATPGSLSYSEGADSAYFSKAQVMEMSRDEIRKNLDKIRQSQAKW